MKKRYLIAVDLDGTLLDGDKRVSPETQDYLRRLQNDGHVIAIASGRPLRAIRGYYDEIGLTGPIICYNGAYVVDPVQNRFRPYSVEISRQIVQEIEAAMGTDCFANIMCETNDEAWVLNDDPSVENFFWKTGIDVHVGAMRDVLDKDPFTMIMVAKNRESDDKLVKVCFSYPGFGLRFWGDSLYSELYFLHVNKGSELLKIAAAYGIEAANIIAFGDGENDIEMLQAAARGIAMSNAEEQLLPYADMVSLADNDHDGVLKTLQYLLATNH